MAELVEDASVDKNARDGYGYTALHLAADRGPPFSSFPPILRVDLLKQNNTGHLEAVRSLLAAGVDTSIRVSIVTVSFPA